MKQNEVKKTLLEVFESLEKGKYDATSQIVGYLTSGDPGYISSYEDSRMKMISLDREEVIEILLNHFLEK